MLYFDSLCCGKDGTSEIINALQESQGESEFEEKICSSWSEVKGRQFAPLDVTKTISSSTAIFELMMTLIR